MTNFHLRSVAATVCAVLLGVSRARAGVYEQRFNYSPGTTSFGDGSTIAENFSETGIPVAGVIDTLQQELQLTQAGVTGTRTAFRLPDLDPGKPVVAFSARWNGQVVGTNLADGVSLSFGNLPADMTTTGISQEDGFGTGLTVAVRTFNGTINGQPAQPGIRAIVNGAQLSYSPGPNFGSNNVIRHYWEVDWAATQGLSVRIDGATYLDHVATPGFVPTPGMVFAYAARTGGFTEEVRLDNVAVVTGGLLAPVPMTAATASAQNAPGETAAQAFDGNPGFSAISATSTSTGTKWLMFDHTGTIGARTADGLPHLVTAYTLVSGNDSPDRYPRDWQLQGSLDGSNWTDIDQVTGEESAYGANVPRTYLVDEPGYYSYYRMFIDENNRTSTSTAGITQLDEIMLYETSVPEPQPVAVLMLAFAALILPRRRRAPRS